MEQMIKRISKWIKAGGQKSATAPIKKTCPLKLNSKSARAMFIDLSQRDKLISYIIPRKRRNPFVDRSPGGEKVKASSDGNDAKPKLPVLLADADVSIDEREKKSSSEKKKRSSDGPLDADPGQAPTKQASDPSGSTIPNLNGTPSSSKAITSTNETSSISIETTSTLSTVAPAATTENDGTKEASALARMYGVSSVTSPPVLNNTAYPFDHSRAIIVDMEGKETEPVMHLATPTYQHLSCKIFTEIRTNARCVRYERRS